MKKYLIIVPTLLFAFLVASCNDPEKETPDGSKLTLTLLEETVNAHAAGGTYTVSYELQGASDTARVTAFCPDEYPWISDIDCSVAGEVRVHVARNEAAEVRTAYITVTCRDGENVANRSLTVNQAENIYDYTLDASDAYCEYYGDMLTYANGPHNFYLMVSDKGWDVAGSTVYNLDIYCPPAEDPDKPVLADGTYKINASTTQTEMTFSMQFSHYCIWNSAANGYDLDLGFKDGEVRISRDGDNYLIEGEVTDANDGLHSFRYYGPVQYISYYEPAEDHYSTLTSDVALDMTDVNVKAFYYGDYYNNGNYNWYLDIRKDRYEGDHLILELMCRENDYSAGIPAGTYTVSPSREAGTCIQGFYNRATNVDSYSWYYSYTVSGDDINLSAFAPVHGGSIVVTDNADGTQTLTIDIVDDNEADSHSLKGSWTGTIQYDDHTNFSPERSVRPRNL